KKLAGKEKIPPLSSQPSDDSSYPPRGRRR
ncbi:DUF2802 domain-containing protein, partial [Vibrio parahaemolyticus]|nr:DUF2802 domain-containing protein [Vibrio parahaemolyticus]